MDRDKDPSDPSTTSHAFDAMFPVWQKVTTVLGGTESMRAAGESYLPRHENERTTAYTDRLEASVLFNAAELTLDSWVGHPFSETVQTHDIAEPILSYLNDVDLQGNNITVFAREWFREGLAKALCHVLVDNPLPQDIETRTLADDQQEGLRPYFCLVRPENLIFAAAEVVNGQEILIHVRIREEELVQDGFTERLRRRIRVFDRLPDNTVQFSMYEFVKAKSKKEEDRWMLIQSPIGLDIDRIPLVTFYANRREFMVGKSPLEDLVDLNISHWQSSSDQRNILTVSRFPMLALSGGDEDSAEVEVGPKRMLYTPDPQARFYYVEHTGAAIESGRKDILDIEEQMSHYGAQFTRRRPAIESATARILNTSESTSSLKDAVIRFNDSLNNAVALLGEWQGTEVTGKVAVLSDFSPEEAEVTDLQALALARGSNDLSRRQYLKELRRHGVLAEDFSEEDNEKELDAESEPEPQPQPQMEPPPDEEPQM